MSMITLTSLWMPIVIATLVAFVASSVLHMLVGHHRHDFRTAPHEQAALQALTALNLAPGEYYVPHPMSSGPNNPGISVLMTVTPPGGIRLATSLTQWVVYQLLITFICAYVASRTLPAGAPYLSVFRVVGTVAFMGLSIGARRISRSGGSAAGARPCKLHVRRPDLRAARCRGIRVAVAQADPAGPGSGRGDIG